MNLQKITIQGTLELQWPVSWGARCCRWRVTLRKGQPHTNLTALTVLACSVTQSCLTLCDPVDCSPSGSSVRGVFPARILGWIAIPFSRGSSWPRDRSRVSCFAGGFFPIWATREAACNVLIVYYHCHWRLRFDWPQANYSCLHLCPQEHGGDNP